LNVFVHPFNILGFENFALVEREFKIHGDSQHMLKTFFINFHLSLSSLRRTIHLEFYDPEYIKEFYEKQAQGYYVKSKNFPFLNSFKSLVGKGLLFS
jgi:hypothetical protein